jgi:uncharacterized membrane protein YkoI
MGLARPLVLALGVALAGSGLALAADPQECLSAEQRRAAIAGHKPVPLARVMRAAHARFGGEVIGARLCTSGQGLVYRLTVLARDGKVTRVAVDAATGRLIGGD